MCLMCRRRCAALALILVLAVSLTACGQWGEKREFQPEERVSTYWFDFSVNEVRTESSWQGRRAEDGCRLVICELEIQSTFSEAVPMGRADFVLLWESGEDTDAPSGSGAAWQGMEGVYPLPRYAEGQLPDEYELGRDETVTGQLVFQVPSSVSRAALMFEEYYADGESESTYTVGDHYLVWLDLGEELQEGPDPS